MLQRNVDSLKRQTCDDWEQVLLHDTVGRGVSVANKALWAYRHLAKGEYIYILDDDDRIVDDGFVDTLKTLCAADQPGIVLFRTRYPDGSIKPRSDLWQFAPKRGQMPVCSYIVRRDLWIAHIQQFWRGLDVDHVSPAGDWYFLQSVWKSNPMTVWVDSIMAEVQRVSRGKPGGADSQRSTSVILTQEALVLGGEKNLQMCMPIVNWAAHRVQQGIVLDVGAHFGAFCVPLLAHHPGLTCHAFEPNPRAADALEGMALINEIEERLSVHRLALADKAGQGTLRFPTRPEFSGLATLGTPFRFEGGHAVDVEMVSLDAWAKEHDLGPVAFIKVDVEGAEFLALTGAQALIERDHPLLILEHQARNLNQLGVKRGAVKDLLTSWGYDWQLKVRDLLCEWPS